MYLKLNTDPKLKTMCSQFIISASDLLILLHTRTVAPWAQPQFSFS